jgi:5-methyltetrahydropteroyltriglutamate--homocysteine methyltransferase
MPQGAIETTVVGSWPQPGWLVDPGRLRRKYVPRVRAPDIWRIAESELAEAQDAATLLAIRDMEDAGVDVVTDGEIRRESYSNRFATALEGIESGTPFMMKVADTEIALPRICGPIVRRAPVELDNLKFLLANTTRRAKITLPGPFTLTKQAKNQFYGDEEETAMAFADAVSAECRDLAAAGAEVIQLDEPWLRTDPDGANRYGVKAINRALAGVRAKTAVHLCFGYGFVVSRDKPKAYKFLSGLADCAVDQISIEAAQPHLDLGVLKDLSSKTIVLGVLDLATNDVETVEEIEARIRRALPFVTPERLMAAPDCGMKYLSRASAKAKLKAMVKAAKRVREG